MSKYKIKNDKQPLTESDIANHMNFGKLLSGYKPVSKTSWLSKGTKGFLGSTIAAVVIVTATIAIYRSVKQKDNLGTQAFINPPINQLNNEADIFLIDNNKDTTIIFKTGSVIFVPANSFKTKDGRDAKKRIRIKYREFHDQVDFIFSGIPMNYDSAGIVRPFESAGMLEVLAFEDDTIPVYLKDGKTLKVNLLSHNDENKFNVYYLDTVVKKWVLNEHETRAHKKDMYKLSKEKEIFLAKHGLLDPNKLLMPKKANPSMSNFCIDYNKEEFPELAVYDGVKFEVSEKDPNYTSEFKNTVWEDVFINRHPDGKNYVLTFKINKRSSSITAAPVFDGKNYEQAINEYGKIRLRHSQMVKAKADSLNALENNLNAKADDINSSNDRFNSFVRNGAVYRSTLISRLGVINFDCPLNLAMLYSKEKRKDGFSPAYFMCNGKKIEPYGAYLIARNINSIYPLGTKGLNEFPVALGNSADIIIVITTDKKVMYIKDEDLRNTNVSGAQINFQVKEIVCEGVYKKGFDLQKIKNAIDI